MQSPQTTGREAHKSLAARAALLLGLAAGGFALWWLFDYGSAGNATWRADRVKPLPGASDTPPQVGPQFYESLSDQEARLQNEAIPFSTEPIEMAQPLILPTGEIEVAGRRSSLDCLTAAIYYEAAYELPAGQRGVAQVVLNRIRHPAFPNSVCQVVYQGSDLRTGCQFTFTCDGSLGRRPSRRAWEEARRVARAALTGTVEPSVGMATHYHAEYVSPYWAPSLDKIAELGTHIFYRWKGAWGRRHAFTQRVAQESPFIEANAEELMAFQPVGTEEFPLPMAMPPAKPQIRADEIGSPVEPQPAGSESRTTDSSLLADRNAGTLLVEDGSASSQLD